MIPHTSSACTTGAWIDVQKANTPLTQATV
jgi:hypothetical protein